MIDLGIVRPGATLYIPFDSFAAATGASSAASNYAVGDILIYKDANTTARASTTGFTATTSFSSVTGINLIIIDLSSDATADFYKAGSKYFVVVSPITIDSQTVAFAAATFEIGYPSAILNTSIATLASQTSFTLTVGPAEDDALNGMWAIVHDKASAVQHTWVQILDYTGSTKTVTLTATPAATFTIAAIDNFSVMGMMPLQPTVMGRFLDVSTGGEAGVDWANVGSPTTSLALTGTTIATTQKVDIETIKTNPVVNGGTITFPTTATLASTTNITAGTITTATNVTTVNGLAADVITAAATAANFGTEVGTAVWASATRTLTAGTNVDGSTFTAIPWNAAWDAEVQSEVADELVLNNLDHLCKVAVADAQAMAEVVDNTIISNILSKSSSTTSYDPTTDSLEALRDNTGTAGAGLTAIDLPNQTMDITGNITGNLSGSVGSVTGAVGSVTGNVGGNVTGSVGSVAANGITATSLDATASAEIADAVWDEAIAGHLSAGSTGLALNSAGAAGDPWATGLPGAYGAGSAGFILGTNLDATVSSRSSQTSVDDLPTNAELATALGTADDATLAQIALVKAKTDQLTFTVANQVDSNAESMNATTILGNGTAGNLWRG